MLNNKEIAKNLKIGIEDVYEAWDYWKLNNLVDFNKNYEEFRFIKIKDRINYKEENNYKLYCNLNGLDIKLSMEINKIIGIYITPQEKINLLRIMDKYNLDMDVIIHACMKCNENHGKIIMPYIEGIIRNWVGSL